MRILSLLLLAQVSWAQGPGFAEFAEKVYTLEDAQRLALLNDARLLSAEQDIIIAEQRVKEARYQFLPELGLTASATKFDARYPFALAGDSRNLLLFPSSIENIYSGRSYMHMSLYEGRRHINTLQLAQTSHKQALSIYESAKRDVQLAAKDAFYRLLLTQQRLETSAAAEQDIAKAVDEGGLSPWERVEAEALLARARANTSEARHSLESAKLVLLKILNIELDTPFKVAGNLETAAAAVDVRKAVLWAIELRPELQSETYRAQMDAISVNLAMSRRNPTLFLAADYEITGQRFPLRQNNWDATVGIKLPFSYDYWSQIRQRKAEQRQGQLKRAEMQDRVRLEVRQAHENFAYWQKEYPLRETHYRRTLTLYEAALKSARQGPSDTLPRARAASELAALKLSYLTATTEHILARARLEWAVGRELQR